MVVSFDNLNSTSGLKKLDEYLFDKCYITGHEPTKDDIYVYAKLSGPPSSNYVCVCRWYNHIKGLLRTSHFGGGQGVKFERSTLISNEASTSSLVAGKISIAIDDDDEDEDVSNCSLCLDADRLLEENRNISDVISKYDDEIRKKPKLADLVVDFLSFDNDIREAIQKSFEIAQSTIKIKSLARQADDSTTKEDGGEKHKKFIDEHESLQKSGHLLTKEFRQVYKLVHHRQLTMLEKLRHAKHLIDMKLFTKLGSLSALRKTSCFVYMAVLLAILVIIVDSSAVGYIFAALTLFYLGIDKWLVTIYNDSKEEAEKETIIISLLSSGTSMGDKVMKGIMSVVKTLEYQSDDKAVLSGIQGIMKVRNIFGELQSSFCNN